MHAENQLPSQVQDLLQSGQPYEKILQELLSMVGKILQVDRCFLYLRNPEKEKGKIQFCWCRNETIPDVTELEWKNDTQTLPQEDPLFAAALKAQPSVYIEDVETADPAIVNRAFEHKTFGHRALIHAHIIDDGNLWGILQPAVFDKPRKWSWNDYQFIEALLPKLTSPVRNYVQSLVVE